MRSISRRLKQVVRGLQTAWSIAGLTLLLALVVELGFQGVFGLKDLGKPRIPPDPRLSEHLPDGAPWLTLHYRELERLSDRWQPYVYFRQRPFSGQTINIGEDGRRKTWEPPIGWEDRAAPSPPLKILTLGGSSLWGFGARDDQTIPSLIARELDRRGIRAEIRNLAEIGYVNTQELVALVRELQAGYRPDLVLFYDGVNDTASALLEGQATVTTNERNRAREFNLLQAPGRLIAALADNLIKNSASYRFAAALGRRLGLGGGESAASQPGRRNLDLDRLAEAVVNGYAASVRLADSLGKAYGFRPVFVWQPVIFFKSNLVPFEREESRKYAWAEDLFQRVRAAVVKSGELTANPAFVDFSGIFKDTESLIFLDFCHTTEEANATVATELVARMIRAGIIVPPGERQGL